MRQLGQLLNWCRDCYCCVPGSLVCLRSAWAVLAKKGLLGCRIAKQVSEFYREIEQLNSIGMLRKYLGKVRVLTTTYMADEASPVPWP